MKKHDIDNLVSNLVKTFTTSVYESCIQKVAGWKNYDLSETILESKDSARYIKKTLIKILTLKITS